MKNINPYESPKGIEETLPNFIDNLLIIFYYLNIFTFGLIFCGFIVWVFLDGYSWMGILGYLIYKFFFI